MSLLRKIMLGFTLALMVLIVVSYGSDKDATVAADTTSIGNSSSSGSSSSDPVSSVLDAASLTLSDLKATVVAGKTCALTAAVSPTDAGSVTLTWKSSDTSVATVDSNGVVTGMKDGTCTISVVLPNGFSVACALTVTGKPVESVTLSKSSAQLIVGQGTTLAVKISPSDAEDKTLSWKSSNTSVATVDASGNVSAKGSGVCAITVSSMNSISSACTVTVVEPVAVSSVSLSSTAISIVNGNTYKLTASVSPGNATVQTLTWESSNPAVATVNSSGKITAKGVGKCSITASSTNYKMAICVVTVTAPVVSPPASSSSSQAAPKMTPVLAIETPPNSDGYYGSSLTITGYALNATGVSSVNIYLDTVDQSEYKGTAQIGIARSDIAAKHPTGYLNNGTSGFSYTLDISGLDFASTHNIYAVAVGNDGVQIQSSASFLAGNVVYTSYSSSLSAAIAKQSQNTPAMQVNGTWEFAKIMSGVLGYYKGSVVSTNWLASDTEYNNIISKLSYYIDPSNFVNDPVQKYQSLKLSYVDCVTAAQLNAVFGGVLSGHGDDFLAAAKAYNVNPVYLAGHAIEETNNGTSQLSTGVVVPTADYPAGTYFYNLFGINANDTDTVGSGSKYAASKGWDSIDDAINGGAQWISGNYISRGQDTVYKMRWNPANPGTHEYATDVKWAFNQMNDIKTCFDYFSGVKLVFDIPKYAS